NEDGSCGCQRGLENERTGAGDARVAGAGQEHSVCGTTAASQRFSKRLGLAKATFSSPDFWRRILSPCRGHRPRGRIVSWRKREVGKNRGNFRRIRSTSSSAK